jgi:hypothetical protein
MAEDVDLHWLPAGNTSVPRCTTCGGRVLNGRCRWANDANGFELGVLDVELQSLLDQLRVSADASLPITKMVQANKA